MSQIKYTKNFTEKVKGELRAEFRLNAQGEPLFRTVGNGLKEYKIKLSLSAPTASEIESVTYFMDDETFWDPVAASNDRDNDFTQQISSYGEVPVKVTVRFENGKKIKQEAWLSNLLEAGHAGDNSPAILNAIADIKAN
jgi:hypothetical protein